MTYNKNKNKFSIPGFRKGKAPLAMLEKMYGAGIFYEDAANEVIDASYPKAAEESKEEIVSTPEIKVTQIEKGKGIHLRGNRSSETGSNSGRVQRRRS